MIVISTIVGCIKKQMMLYNLHTYVYICDIPFHAAPHYQKKGVCRRPGQVAHHQGTKTQGKLQQHHIDLAIFSTVVFRERFFFLLLFTIEI